MCCVKVAPIEGPFPIDEVPVFEEISPDLLIKDEDEKEEDYYEHPLVNLIHADCT